MGGSSRAQSRFDLELVLGVAFLAALIAWYVHAGEAHSRTLDFPHYLPIPIVMLAVAGIGFVRSTRRGGRRWGAGLGAAVAAGLPAVVIAASLNVALDRSPGVEQSGHVVAVVTPSKGPRMLRVRLGADEVSFLRELAPECAADHPIVVVVRRGALGGEWVERARCGEGR
jgi:hypothetical protein